jgi:hypothetical protein
MSVTEAKAFFGAGKARAPADLVNARSTLTGEHLAAYVGTGPRASRTR